MKLYTNTSMYRETLICLDQIEEILKPLAPSAILANLENEIINLSSEMAVALEEPEIEQVDYKLSLLEPRLIKAIQLCNLAHLKHQITQSENDRIEHLLTLLQQKIKTFPQKRKNVLILSSIMGQGHMSASKAIVQGVEHLYGRDYNVSIIDFYEVIGSLFNKATVKAYEGSTKYLPDAYKYFFEATDAKWPVKFLNLINYPLNAARIEKLFKSYNPHIIISNYPIWEYLAELIIKKMGNIKFLSLVTDSISIHNAWATAKPDAHIVANFETAISMKKLGVSEDKIQILGFPVKLEFSTPTNRTEFLTSLNLNPDLYTVVFIPITEKAKATVKVINEIRNGFQDINLIVICGRNAELYPKLEEFDHQKNTRIIGWTDQMPEFIKNCDLVVTKAGGATVMECIAAKKPMVITSVIPGQEMGNAELIKLHELGIIQKEAKMSVNECIEYIKKNHSRILENLTRISNPDASLKIARYIHQEIENS
jgi:processive 1,2-diacylglycerol beta-glucosyltransferase